MDHNFRGIIGRSFVAAQSTDKTDTFSIYYVHRPLARELACYHNAIYDFAACWSFRYIQNICGTETQNYVVFTLAWAKYETADILCGFDGYP